MLAADNGQDLRTLSEDGGIAEFRSPGLPATAPRSLDSHMARFSQDKLVGNEEQAQKFVEKRVGEGADYINIVADLPGLNRVRSMRLWYVFMAHDWKM